jgi:hypothetical protein
MSKIQNGRLSRVLRDEELALVSGGFHDVELVAARRRLSPLEIYGFNPQPDPPGTPF